MIYNALFWLSLNLLSIVVLSFYSMMEMACVSFNKVRLQYYVTKGIKQAIWLNYLLHNPSRLFGTTLIGVNVAMFAGSECAREFHQAIGLSPDLAPLSQVVIVIIFGELAPMFAARRYAEHVAMLGIPLVYLSAKLMTPFLWILAAISFLCDKLFGGKESETKIFLTKEELLKILESQEDDKTLSIENEEFNAIAANILQLHKKGAKDVMNPIKSISLIPSSSTVEQARQIFQKSESNYLPVYHNEQTNIIGIVTPRNLIRASDNRKTRDFVRSPWFITESTKASQLLNQFRHNNQNVAIVLNQAGLAIGIVILDDLMAEIFGKIRTPQKKKQNVLIMERTFPATMKVAEFNAQFDVVLDPRPNINLADLVREHLGHAPEIDESVYIYPFELTVKETSRLDIKVISIKTRLN